MAKGELRNPPEQDGKINPRAYGLTGQLERIVAAAMRDPDPVSMMSLGKTPETAHVAIVVLKGRDCVALFEQWGERNKILHDTSSGMVAALQSVDVTQDPAEHRELWLEAAHYVRDAAVFEPEEDPDAPPIGHELADRMFEALGVDTSGPEHAHTRMVDDEDDRPDDDYDDHEGQEP